MTGQSSGKRAASREVRRIRIRDPSVRVFHGPRVVSFFVAQTTEDDTLPFHVGGVVMRSIAHRAGLVRSMITGYERADQAEGGRSGASRPPVRRDSTRPAAP